MSASPPPQVELIRPETEKTLSADLVDPTAGHDAAELHLLGERDDVGLQAELLVGPGRAGEAHPGLHLVEHEQRVVGVAHLLHRPQELRPHVVVPALTLDRLGEEARDVVRLGLEGRPAWARARASACSTSARWSASGNLTAGTSILGQSNFGNRSVLAGSVLVSDRVYPDRPWNARVRCSTLPPSRGDRPAASLRRLFQSNAVFSAFSTASAPPSTKNRCGSAGSPSTRTKVSTNCA